MVGREWSFPPAFIERTVSTSADEAVFVRGADMDRDGDLDVLWASEDVDRHLIWYENNGANPPEFTFRSVGNADGQWSVIAADMDGDGDADLVSPASADNRIVLCENDGASPPEFTHRVISYFHGHRILPFLFAAELSQNGLGQK